MNIWLNFGLVFILWLSYGLLHSLMASSQIKRWSDDNLGLNGRYYRLLFIVIAFLSVFAPLFYHLTLPSTQLWPLGTFQKLMGAVLATSGVFIIKRAFGNYSLSSFIGLKKEESDPILITNGLQSKVRHPLYTGTLMFFWGWFIFSNSSSNLALALAMHAYTLIGIVWEERKLVETFGEAYIDYQKRVPKLWPGFSTLHKPHQQDF